jgi:hypothetical protein
LVLEKGMDEEPGDPLVLEKGMDEEPGDPEPRKTVTLLYWEGHNTRNTVGWR